MKRILEKGKHLLKAKGRHGTHSPFVYAFVEQVMRSKRRFHIAKSPLSQKQLNLTGRTIVYLNPEIVYADAFLFETVNALVNDISDKKLKVLPLDTLKNDYEDGACFVYLPDKESNAFMTNIARQCICSAIMPLNQKDENEKQCWETLYKEPVFKMALDSWYIGFVSNHPDFKIKQYFRLR